MDISNYILIQKVAIHFPIEETFIWDLHHNELIKIINLNDKNYIHIDELNHLEKIIRIHVDLEINIEGIDVVLNLLQQIENLEGKVKILKSKLDIVEYKEFTSLN